MWMRLREIVVIELREEKQWGREWWKSLGELKEWKLLNGVKVNKNLAMLDVEKECGIIEKRENGVWVKYIECI